MKKVSDSLRPQVWSSSLSEAEMANRLLADKEVADFITRHHLEADQIKLSLPKFNQFLVERERFTRNDPAYLAKGYEPVLMMNEGYADVAYRETEVFKKAQAERKIADRITVMGLPKSYKSVVLGSFDLDDIQRIEAFKAVEDFLAHYPCQGQKGLYVYGDMGIGKSYLMAALAHELADKKQAKVTFLHYPTFTIDVKNAIGSGTVKEEIDAVKTAEILILDDIGAEQVTAWVRDEVLQVILQHRMQEELPTFFTSNYSFEDLERKLATTKSGDETWQAKRVMERVRVLAKELHLQGENRR